MKKIFLVLVLILSLSAKGQLTSLVLHGDTLFNKNPSTGDSIQLNRFGALLKEDTANMLAPYARIVNVVNGATKMNYTDTANMLSPYLRSNIAASTYALINSPTFTGTVGGITASMVGLGNVTNESKATMFTSPTFTGTVSGITAAMVGLGNVNNTTDAGKPISTATQTALDLKANLVSPSFTTPALGTPSSGNLANCTFPTLNQNTSGSAATLTTPRNINGVAFDGSANITVPSNIAASTSGNVMTSNGTVWTSAANNGGWTVSRVTGSNYTNGTTSLTDITGLVSSTLATGTLYEFEANLFVNSSSTAGMQVAVQQTGTGSGQITAWSGTATNATASGMAIGNNALNTASAACVLVNGDGSITMKGFIKTGSSGSPTILLRALKTTSGTATVYIGSAFRYRLAQ